MIGGRGEGRGVREGLALAKRGAVVAVEEEEGLFEPRRPPLVLRVLGVLEGAKVEGMGGSSLLGLLQSFHRCRGGPLPHHQRRSAGGLPMADTHRLVRSHPPTSRLCQIAPRRVR